MSAPVFATLGCRLNAYETEAMKELAEGAGLSNAVIVNTDFAAANPEAVTGFLRAIANGLTLNLDTLEDAEQSATALKAALRNAEVTAEFDARSDKHILRISRIFHGNTKYSIINADFVHGADYEALSKAGTTFNGLLTPEALVRRGEGEKAKEAKVADFRAAMAWLITQAENSVGRQRYKGLGEMNPEQLWETTMDPNVRRLLRVQIDDAIEADRVFTMLMGDEVEPRRDFIETNALRAGNIDV